MIRQIQGKLKLLGYYDGTVDGKMGPLTRDAIDVYKIAKGRRGGYLDMGTLKFNFRNSDSLGLYDFTMDQYRIQGGSDHPWYRLDFKRSSPSFKRGINLIQTNSAGFRQLPVIPRWNRRGMDLRN